VINAMLTINPYGAAVLAGGSLDAADIGVDAFARWLQSELPALADSYKLCWLTFNAAETAFIAPALQHGFGYHHVQGTNITLVKRLQPDAYLPLAATHSIGVGAAVLNQLGQILLVREWPLPGKKPAYFKLPGGMVETQEHFVEALQREVLEETGVAAVFQGWFAMRHHHQGQFGASNLYLVAKLSSQQTDVCADLREIAEAAWFDPQAFLADPLAHPYNKLLVQGALESPIWTARELPSYQAGPLGFELFQGF
jgi:8-oxo-dGTP diphosphatase